MAYVHPTLPAALETVLELAVQAEQSQPDLHVDVVTTADRVTVRITDRGETIPLDELRVLNDSTETPTDHPLGLESWLVRWSVLASGGELVVRFEGNPELDVNLVTDGSEGG